jgi:hypothetical protein
VDNISGGIKTQKAITEAAAFALSYHIVFVWSLPYGLYLCVVLIPSVWNLFGVVLILYLISAMRMNKTATV